MTGTARAAGQPVRWVWVAAEILLVATTIASILALSRIFSDDSFVAPLIFTSLVAHGVLVALRWFGFGTVVCAAGSLLATAASIAALHYSTSALAVVFPTGDTLSQLRIDLDQARTVFQEMKAPVPPVVGFLVVTSAALWILIFAADWAAFRILAPGQALVPYLAMIIFVSMLGTDDQRLQSTSIVVICGVLFLLAHRAGARAAEGIWLDHGPGRGYLSLMTAGGLVALIAAAVGIVGGPLVPGAEEAPLIEFGDEGRNQNKPLEVISPLVQIQPRLVDQSDQILFTVETTQRAYWRIAALDVFDGSLWRSEGQFRGANDALEVRYPISAPVGLVTQTFDLGELNVVWAPAAYLPTRFTNLSTAGVNFEAESATFIVDTNDQRVSDGLRYTIESQIPQLTGELLTQLGSQPSVAIDQRYLDLPDGFSPLARAEAERITAGLTDPYSKALALQDYFRENFIYDIDVAKGHDIQRLEDFLTIQRGYCEQFAGTYAAMARAVGLPSRVATGFTPGEPDPANPNRYIVRGKHAHAWPEVFIAGAGWVAFEPTPGRGAPNASAYTGVPEAQDSFDAAPAETEPAPVEEPSPIPFEEPPLPEVLPEEPVEPVVAAERSAFWSNLLRILLVIGLIAGWIFGIPALKRLRAARRAAKVGPDPRRRITLAWATAMDQLEAHGETPHEGETLQEYAMRVQRARPNLHPSLGDLTDLTTEAAYRSGPPSEANAKLAEMLAYKIGRRLAASQSWPARSASQLDPRPLVRLRDPIYALATRLADGATAGDPLDADEKVLEPQL